jgi:endonuclease/exonuclease/phosphatase family metal-dependent hydrolase
MLRFLSLVAALALLASCVTPNRANPSVRLATWNLEHLAERNGEGCRPRTEADYETLRQHVAQLGADVVAFQEVENAGAAARVFPASGWTVVMSDRPGGPRHGFCRGTTGPTILKQDVGFAIRKGISFGRNPDLSALGLGNPDLRWGVDVTLDLPRPIRLLAVHLKSGCNTKQDMDVPDCPVLLAQAPVLEGWIDARARAGEDFVVMGDWNRRTALPGDEFLKVVSDDDPPGGRLVFANADRQASCVQRYRDFIDHIALGRDTARRVMRGSFAEYTYGVPEDQHPADHCPNSVAISPK